MINKSTLKYLVMLILLVGYNTVVRASSNKVDLVVFSYNRPMQLYAFLESAGQHLHGIDTATVIYRADYEYQAGYEIVKEKFDYVQFLCQQNPPQDFRGLFQEAAFGSKKAKYILFAVDDIVVKDYVDLNYCANLIEQEQVYAFILRLGCNINHCYMLNLPTPVPSACLVAPNIYKYKFSDGQGDWAYPNTLDMALYRKSDVKATIFNLEWNYPNECEGRWAARANLNQQGLFFEESKVVNLPLNLVNNSRDGGQNRCSFYYSARELLDQFLAGYKIDIKPISKMQHNTPHVDSYVNFINR